MPATAPAGRFRREDAQLLLKARRLDELTLTNLENVVIVMLVIRKGGDRDSPQVRLRGAVEVHGVEQRVHRVLARILIIRVDPVAAGKTDRVSTRQKSNRIMPTTVRRQ